MQLLSRFYSEETEAQRASRPARGHPSKSRVHRRFEVWLRRQRLRSHFLPAGLRLSRPRAASLLFGEGRQRALRASGWPERSPGCSRFQTQGGGPGGVRGRLSASPHRAARVSRLLLSVPFPDPLASCRHCHPISMLVMYVVGRKGDKTKLGRAQTWMQDVPKATQNKPPVPRHSEENVRNKGAIYTRK